MRLVVPWLLSAPLVASLGGERRGARPRRRAVLGRVRAFAPAAQARLASGAQRPSRGLGTRAGGLVPRSRGPGGACARGGGRRAQKPRACLCAGRGDRPTPLSVRLLWRGLAPASSCVPLFSTPPSSRPGPVAAVLPLRAVLDTQVFSREWLSGPLVQGSQGSRACRLGRPLLLQPASRGSQGGAHGLCAEAAPAMVAVTLPHLRAPLAGARVGQRPSGHRVWEPPGPAGLRQRSEARRAGPRVLAGGRDWAACAPGHPFSVTPGPGSFISSHQPRSPCVSSREQGLGMRLAALWSAAPWVGWLHLDSMSAQ